MRRRVWPPSSPSDSSPSCVAVEDDAAPSSSCTAPGRLLDQDLDRRRTAEAAPRGDRVGGVAGGRVARLQRRGQPALRPEAGALGEGGAGDEADRAAALGRAQRRPEAGRAAADDGDVELGALRLSPCLSADRLDLAAQPGGRGLARAGLARRRSAFGLGGAALGLLDPLLGRLGLRLDLAEAALGVGDRPLLGLALAPQLLIVRGAQLLQRLARGLAPSPGRPPARESRLSPAFRRSPPPPPPPAAAVLGPLDIRAELSPLGSPVSSLIADSIYYEGAATSR